MVDSRRQRRVPGRPVGGAALRASQAAAATAANTASEPFTGGPVAGARSSTSTGGMSTARRMPNERIVRSWTVAVVVDRDALATTPSRAPCGRRRCSRSAARPRRAARRTRTRTRDAPSASTVGLGDRAAPGRRTGPASPRGAGQQHRRLGPARGPQRDRRRRAGDVDLLDDEPGRDRRDGVGDARGARPPGARRCRRRRTPAGDRRALRARGARRPRATSSTRTGAAVLGRPARARPRRRRRLRPCRRRRRRWRAATPARRRARTTTRRARGRRARPTSCAASAPSRPAGSVERAARRRRWCAGPAPCRPRPGPRPASRRPPSRRRRRAPPPARRPARCRRRSRRAPRATSGADPLRRAALDARPAGRGVEVARARRRRRAVATSHASRIVRQPVQRQRWASSARSTAAVVAGRAPLARSAGEPHDDARRAEPALAGAGGAERVGPARRASSSGRPSTVVIDRPATRRAGRDAGDPGLRRRPAPCSTRTGPAGCSRPWPSAAPRSVAQHLEQRARRRRRPRPAGRRPRAGASGDLRRHRRQDRFARMAALAPTRPDAASSPPARRRRRRRACSAPAAAATTTTPSADDHRRRRPAAASSCSSGSSAAAAARRRQPSSGSPFGLGRQRRRCSTVERHADELDVARARRRRQRSADADHGRRATPTGIAARRTTRSSSTLDRAGHLQRSAPSSTAQPPTGASRCSAADARSQLVQAGRADARRSTRRRSPTPRASTRSAPREPACPLHDVTLAAGARGRASRSRCSSPPRRSARSAICGPVLDVLLDAQRRLTRTCTFVHAEVYTDPHAAPTTTHAGASTQLGLALRAGARSWSAPTASSRERLDTIFDRDRARRGAARRLSRS